MIVIDSSALLDLVLHTPGQLAVQERLAGYEGELHAPHLIDLEIAQVVRRHVAAGEVDAERGRIALADLASFPLERHRHDVFLRRIWSLRANLTAYDAAYVALAEALDAPLLTRDQRIARAAGHWARVELI